MGKVEVAAAAAAVAGAATYLAKRRDSPSSSPAASPSKEAAKRLHRLSQSHTQERASRDRARQLFHASAAAPAAPAAVTVRIRSLLGTLFSLIALLVGACACVAAYVPIPGVTDLRPDLVSDSTRIYILSLGLATVAASLSFLVEEGARSRRARRAASPRPLPSVHEEPADEPLASAEELRVLGMLLSGDWAKDKKNSSSMDAALDIIQANWFLRQAVKLINGMTVKVEHGHFRFSVYSAIKVFAIKENYAVDGEEAHFPRRDLRRGAATGRCTVYRDRVQLNMSWNEPFVGKEVFTPRENGAVLHVHCQVQLRSGAHAAYTHIYVRKTPMRTH